MSFNFANKNLVCKRWKTMFVYNKMSFWQNTYNTNKIYEVCYREVFYKY